ncbi:MAG: hypothetical protein SPK00_03340 [Corynebacterium glucuronolyticum]|nr:hypothetical protein [Mycobacteriaceae bacterium]MDY5833771.1 hypothetical protein [Corynebacterium glucuronolyticum]
MTNRNSNDSQTIGSVERRALEKIACGRPVCAALVTELHRIGLIWAVPDKTKWRPTGLTDRGLKVLNSSKEEA